MDELKIEVQNGAGGVRIFRLEGPLVLGTMFEFQDRVRSETGAAIVVDLGGVPYMDSAGLGAVLGVLASCQRHKRGFALASLNDRIRTLLHVAKVEGMLPIFDSVQSAEAKLANSAKA